MRKIVYTYWRETDGKYLGYLNEYPGIRLVTSPHLGERARERGRGDRRRFRQESKRKPWDIRFVASAGCSN